MPICPTSSLPDSLWAATATPASPCARLDEDVHVEHLIIGAGYVGLSTALHLAERGHQVMVIDANEPGWGASGRNGGQIISGLKQLPDDLEQVFGRDAGERMVSGFGGSGQLLRELVARYGIECDLTSSGWLQVAHATKAFDTILVPKHRQWAARGVAGELLDRDQVATKVGSVASEYVGGWFDPRGGTLQPLSYARGLATAVQSLGAKVCARTPAMSLTGEGPYLVTTPNARITADKVVVATNAYTDGLIPRLNRTVVPVTSFQLATQPLSATLRHSILPQLQGVTDTRRLLHYFRLDRDGRLLMGGRCPVEDNPSFDDARSLQQSLARIFPEAAQVPLEYVWSGKVALTKDSLPHMHVLGPNLYAALGCNGRGVANATFVGQQLAALIDGAEPQTIACPLTALDTFAFHAYRKLGIVAMSTYYRILDRLEQLSRAPVTN